MEAAENIDAVVEELGGFDRVNRIVKGALREWYLGAAREALDASEERGEAPGALAFNLAETLLNAGKSSEAEPLYRRAMDAYEAAYETPHQNMLTSANNLGNIYATTGRHADAEPLYRRAFEGYYAYLGPNHRHTMRAAGNLGILLMDMDRLEDAEPLLQRAQEVRSSAIERASDRPRTRMPSMTLVHAPLYLDRGSPKRSVRPTNSPCSSRSHWRCCWCKRSSSSGRQRSTSSPPPEKSSARRHRTR